MATLVSAQSARTLSLIENAKREGSLVWYTAMNVRDAEPILEEFRREFPFIKTEITSLAGERLITRAHTEILAGKWLFDVASTNGLSVMRDKLQPYISPESVAFAKEFKDSDGRWTGYDHNYYVFAYNTASIEKTNVPHSYEDLLATKWRGKIVMDPEDYEWYGTLVVIWGREKAGKYMEQLARQNINWRKSHSLIVQLIVAGEYPLGIGYANGVERARERGAPVDWVDTTDPIVTGTNAVGIGAGSRNPNAAKLFVDFLLSRRGQGILKSQKRVPVRDDIKPLFIKADPARLRLRQVPEEVYRNIGEYGSHFRKIFGL
jgi:iron(III) transport system substrate-binding protein